MTRSLKLLFEAIRQVQDEADLRTQLTPQIGEYFAATRSSIFFLDQLQANRKLQKVVKLALSIEHNPIARYIAERHSPVHEGLVTTPKTWAMVCPRPDHWHVMAGPLIDCGQIIGVVGCTRDQSMRGFDAQNLADLSAICLHLSVWRANVRSRSDSEEQLHYLAFKSERLTPRELQIAKLVALGQTNAEIGTELWITENSVKQALKRMFRKLGVTSRTELVVQITATQQPLAR